MVAHRQVGQPQAASAPKLPEDVNAERFAHLLATYPGRLIFISMAACGVVPVQLTRPYMPSASPTSSSLLYCVALSLLVTYATFVTLCHNLPGLFGPKSALSLQQRLECMSAVVSLAPIALMPMMWLEGTKFARKTRQFCTFQVEFEKITKTKLHMTRQFRKTKRILVLIYGSHALDVAAQIVTGEASLASSPAYVASYLFLYHVVFWQVSWVTQHRIDAHRILSYLKRSPKAEAETRLRESRRLWVTLRDIQDGCTTLGWLIFFLLVFLFFMLTMSFYQVISLRRHGYTVAAWKQAASGVVMFLAIYAMCDASHKCAGQMNGRFIQILDEMISDVDDKQTSRAINLFYLTITAYPFKVSLGGFTNCNRPLASTVISAAVTYLVVLVQFQNVDREILVERSYNSSKF